GLSASDGGTGQECGRQRSRHIHNGLPAKEPQEMENRLTAEEAEPPSSVIGAHGLLSVAISEKVENQPAAQPPFFAPGLKQPRKRILGRERFPISPRSQIFRRTFFPAASAADWSDWRWQLRNRVRDLNDLARIVNLSADEAEAIRRHAGSL